MESCARRWVAIFKAQRESVSAVEGNIRSGEDEAARADERRDEQKEVDVRSLTILIRMSTKEMERYGVPGVASTEP